MCLQQLLRSLANEMQLADPLTYDMIIYPSGSQYHFDTAGLSESSYNVIIDHYESLYNGYHAPIFFYNGIQHGGVDSMVAAPVAILELDDNGICACGCAFDC